MVFYFYTRNFNDQSPNLYKSHVDEKEVEDKPDLGGKRKRNKIRQETWKRRIKIKKVNEDRRTLLVDSEGKLSQ